MSDIGLEGVEESVNARLDQLNSKMDGIPPTRRE